MVENAAAAQAQILLDALHEQVADISKKLERAEMRGVRTSARGALHDRREHSALRSDLYEAHRLIDGLHKRFPETRPPQQSVAPARRMVSGMRARADA